MQQLNKVTEAGNCQVCMWILSKRFPEEFDRSLSVKSSHTFDIDKVQTNE